jgi:hypothetical protein
MPVDQWTIIEKRRAYASSAQLAESVEGARSAARYAGQLDGASAAAGVGGSAAQCARAWGHLAGHGADFGSTGAGAQL